MRHARLGLLGLIVIGTPTWAQSYSLYPVDTSPAMPTGFTTLVSCNDINADGTVACLGSDIDTEYSTRDDSWIQYTNPITRLSPTPLTDRFTNSQPRITLTAINRGVLAAGSAMRRPVLFKYDRNVIHLTEEEGMATDVNDSAWAVGFFTRTYLKTV